ncbi:MAG: hypothetical protein ACI88L_000517 [Candidatus Paceibacteria bacterium]|jgi:hypothetical protein
MENSLASKVDKLLFNSFTNDLSRLEVGANLLVIRDGVRYLMKYESFGTLEEKSNVFSFNRHYNMPGRSLYPDGTLDDRLKHKLHIYGTHMIKFVRDEEFDLLMPSSEISDIFLILAKESKDSEIESFTEDLRFILDDFRIEKYLSNVLPPNYVKNIIIPFMNGKATKLKIPGSVNLTLRNLLSKKGRSLFAEYTEKSKHGDFVYVGCKEEVYLLGVAKHNGRLYMQGTYTTSTKPILYFSNNYINFISKHDAEKPKFRGEGSVNVAEYRTYDIPSFHSKPFVFPQIGRSQNCKNVIFTGEPEIVTSNIEEAIEHFVTTDFAEYSEVVRSYHDKIGIIYPSSGETNGMFYY